MRQLDLDFLGKPAPSRWGWMLLAISLAFGAALLVTHERIADQTGVFVQQIRQIEERLPGASTVPEPVAADTSLITARSVVDQSRRPWPALFSALESADNPDVALLEFSPEAGRSQIKIYAEARNLAAMLAYQRRLEASGVLRQVVLQNHDLAKETPDAPARFHLVADWKVDHGGR